MFWRETHSRRNENPGRATPVPDDRFAVHVHTDPSRVDRQWQLLEPAGTVFQTRAWLLPWYRTLGARYKVSPLFVTVEHRDTGRPLMFFPLCVRRKRGLIIVEFPDQGVSDYNAPIVAPDLELRPGEMHGLWQQICRRLPPADIFHIIKMPEILAGRAIPLTELDWLRRLDLRSWTVKLPKTRAEYDKTIVKPKDRKEQRRKRRHLVESLGDVTLLHAATEDQRRENFHALARQRRSRFTDCRRKDILSDPAFFRFYETVALEDPGRIVALSALQARDKAVATLLALVHNDRYVLLMHSFDTGLDRLSPGIVAIDEMITCAIENGMSFFDFTIGNEPYKRQFGTESGVLYEGIYPLSAKGHIFAVTKAAGRRVKSAAGPLWMRCCNSVAGLPARVKTKLQGLIGTAVKKG
jgi:CelD/BcsL family acetyltransferase involved in cellulose biosynthesis